MSLPLRLVEPPRHPRIDLRCCSCTDVEWGEADLVIADPPWDYVQTIGATRADNHYKCLRMPDIIGHVDRIPGRLLACWLTWPQLGEWSERTGRKRWSWGRIVTGGAWAKTDGRSGRYGSGYWIAGDSEPFLLYHRGGGHNDRRKLRNAWLEAREQHSRKPARWMAQWIRRWVPEGGLVCDPYAGLGSVAEAVLLAGGGRRYLGTEIDHERHGQALALLAQTRAAS